MSSIAPSQISQKDIIEEVEKIKRAGERGEGLTDVRGTPVYTDDDSRTPKEQQEDKKLTKKRTDKLQTELLNIRNLEDIIAKNKLRLNQLLDILSQKDKIYNEMKSKGVVSQTDLENMELERGRVREEYNKLSQDNQQLELSLSKATASYKRKSSQEVQIKRPDKDADGGGNPYNSGGMTF